MTRKSAPLSQNHICVRATQCAGSLLAFVPRSLGPPGAGLSWGGGVGGHFVWQPRYRANPVGQLCLFGLAPGAFTAKVFTNATASSSHALSASFVGTGGSI